MTSRFQEYAYRSGNSAPPLHGDLLLLVKGEQEQAQARRLHEDADQDQRFQFSRKKPLQYDLPLQSTERDAGAEIFLKERINNNYRNSNKHDTCRL